MKVNKIDRNIRYVLRSRRHQRQDVLIYNAVSKSGSTTLSRAIQKLAKRNGFATEKKKIKKKNPKSEWNGRLLSRETQVGIVQSTTKYTLGLAWSCCLPS